MEKEISETEKNLILLNKQLDKLNSYSHQFFLSIIRGVGTVLGATLIFSIVIALLVSFLKSTGLFPAIENLLSVYQGDLPTR